MRMVISNKTKLIKQICTHYVEEIEYFMPEVSSAENAAIL